jgi:hypothetical protein
MLSVKKNKFFSSLLLSLIFLFIGSSAAQAVDIPELSWERGRQQSITLGGQTSTVLWTVSLDGAGKSLKFDRSSTNDAGFIVYSLDIPEDLAVGKYQVIVRGPQVAQTITAYVNILDAVSYDPQTDPRGIGVIAVAAYTLLAFFSGNKNEVQTNNSEEEEDSSALGSVDTNYQGIKVSARGPGDDSTFARNSFARRLDSIRHIAVSAMARRSPLTMRISADGSYLQALVGPLTLLLPLIGLTLGAYLGATTFIANSLIPTSLAIFMAIMLVGIFDAFSGLLAFVAYVSVLVVRSGIENVADIRTLLGLSLVWFTPSLAAGATRPLRRAREDWDRWERITDFVVSTILTTWAIKSMVLALDGFAHQKTSIATHSQTLALIGGGAVLIRYGLEEFVSRHAPARMEYMTPAKVASQDFDSFCLTLATRAGIFIFFMFGFFGLTWQIFAATAILVVPAFIKRFDSKFPNVPFLFQISPGGIPSIIFMSFIGFLFCNWVNTLPLLSEDKTKTLVIVTSIPGLVITAMKLFGRSPKKGDVRWYRRDKYRKFYVVSGPIMLAVAILITVGVIP